MASRSKCAPHAPHHRASETHRCVIIADCVGEERHRSHSVHRGPARGDCGGSCLLQVNGETRRHSGGRGGGGSGGGGGVMHCSSLGSRTLHPEERSSDERLTIIFQVRGRLMASLDAVAAGARVATASSCRHLVVSDGRQSPGCRSERGEHATGSLDCDGGHSVVYRLVQVRPAHPCRNV